MRAKQAQNYQLKFAKMIISTSRKPVLSAVELRKPGGKACLLNFRELPIILKSGIYLMDALASETFLEQLIRNQRKAIRYYVSFVVGLVTLGVIVIGLAFVSPIWFTDDSSIVSDVFKGLFGLGGSFVLTLSGFQFKEISNRKEKIEGFETIRGQLKNLKESPKAERVRTQKQIEELMWKYIEKTALS